MTEPSATCRLEGCGRTDVVLKTGYCLPHHRRLLRTGRVGEARMQPQAAPECAVDGCSERGRWRGLCQTHAYRLNANGDPLVVRSPGAPAGPTNPAWIGDEARYSAVHRRLREYRGRAAQFECVECSGQAAEWAYIHGSPAELWDAKVRRRYSTNLDDYQPMCIRCHRNYDAGHHDQPTRRWIAAAS